MAKPLFKIAAQHKDRNTAIIAAYKIGTYSQREIREFYQLYPTTIEEGYCSKKQGYLILS